MLEIPLPTRRSTLHLAKRLASILKPSDLVILSGNLGAGKTFMVRGIARALGLPSEERVTSPTFALIQELETTPQVVHADLYRLSEPEDAIDLGLDAARSEGSVLIVEWGAPFAEMLGGDALMIDIQLSPRRASVKATGQTSEARVQELSKLLPLPVRGRAKSALNQNAE